MRLLIALLFPILVQAQKKPDPGSILSDSNFICIDPIQPDSAEFGIREICHSENPVEIRLKTSFMATTELIVFFFNNNEWVVEKYYPDYITKKRKVISTIMIKVVKKDSTGLYAAIFDSLKANDLFLIPDQRVLKERLIISDGVGYTITFKVGNLYRRYYYGGPHTNAKYYPKVPEYRKMIEIIDLLDDILR